MAETPTLDSQAIDALRELNPGDDDAFLREIVGIFLDDTPQRIAEIEQSFSQADVPTLIRAAHSVKGSSSNLGATALRAAASAVEQSAQVSGLRNLDPLIADLKAEFGRAQAALKALLGGPPAR